MKKSKLVLFAGLFILAVSFQSCKKKYTCVCYFSDGSSETHELKGGSISELEAECTDICL